jgi:hypothetical protein
MEKRLGNTGLYKRWGWVLHSKVHEVDMIMGPQTLPSRQSTPSGDPSCVSSVLFTDEAGFHREDITNFHNSHLWAEDNPHFVVQCRHQQQFSINLWAGTVGDYLVGMFDLPRKLTSNEYGDFSQYEMPGPLHDVPITIREPTWFMMTVRHHISALKREVSWTTRTVTSL